MYKKKNNVWCCVRNYNYEFYGVGCNPQIIVLFHFIFVIILYGCVLCVGLSNVLEIGTVSINDKHV